MIAKAVTCFLGCVGLVLVGTAANAEGPERDTSDAERPAGWWQHHVSVGADLRAGLSYNISGDRDGAEETDLLPEARLRGGVTVSPPAALAATARLAAFFDKETQDVGFRLHHRRDIRPGDFTFDELFITWTPREFFTVQAGRIQTEDPPFELDSVVLDSLSRHDSSGFDVTWTDGLYVTAGTPVTWRLHLVAQANPEQGPTNGVASQGPIEFSDGASRVTFYLALEAPPMKPLTQLVADVTIIPQALRPFGLGTRSKEDVLAFAMRAAADVPVPWLHPVVLHPFGEFGVMVSTPQERALDVSTTRERAGPFAFVTGLDLKRLGPGDLGIQFGWVQAGYLLSPDYPNNAWSVETRYKVGIVKNVLVEIRYRHREEIEKLINARQRQTDDNALARVSVKF